MPDLVPAALSWIDETGSNVFSPIESDDAP